MGLLQLSSSRSLEMQKLFRLCTLDSIGLTSMKHDFKALSSWQQQQSGGSNGNNAADIDQMLTDLNEAFIWQSLVLPIPSKHLLERT